MRHLLVRPELDELISSTWGRTVQHTLLPIGFLTRELTGRKWTPSFFQAGHVEQLAQALGMQASRIVQEHSVIPYATAYMSPASRETISQKALGVGLVARTLGAVTQNVSDYVPFRRWCPECVERELKATGESYWHRSHNLPGVLLCTEHGVALRRSNLANRHTTAWYGFMPHQAAESASVLLPRKDMGFLLQLARASVSSLHAPADADTVGPTWYRQQAFARGLVSPGRDISSGALKTMIQARVDSSLLGLIGFSAGDAELDWVSLMMRPGVRVPFAPLKHVFLRSVLESVEPTDSGGLDHVPTGFTKRSRAEQDARYAPAVKAIIEALIAQGRRARVAEVLEQAGCWHLYRHERDSYPLIRNEVVWLRTSHASVKRTTARRIATVNNRSRR